MSNLDVDKWFTKTQKYMYGIELSCQPVQYVVSTFQMTSDF